jgi:hypothetical protein
VLYGVFRWIESVRFWHPRSGLRGLVITVAATVAFVLALVALLGTWGGYVMFLVAALAAVATSTAADARAALLVLGGMALVAAGPATVKAALQSHAEVALVVWLVVAGVLQVAAGTFLVARRDRPWTLSEYRAKQFAALGIVGLAGAVASAGAGSLVHSPENAAAFLPLAGMCAAATGTGLLTLFPRERRDRIRARLRRLAREPRGRSLGEVARQLRGHEDPA